MSRKDRSGSTDATTPGPERMSTIFRRCGFSLSPLQLSRMWTYHQLLRERNPELNLTRIHNFDNMVLKLYVDSVLPVKFLTLPTSLMDLGSGPGMPGVPIKIVVPEVEVLLAESRRKRVDFLETVVERLNLEGVRIIGRSVTSDCEFPVQGVITRAVGTICDTLDRISGSLARGGPAIFMKGPQCDAEIRDARMRYGHRYELVENISYKIPNTPHERRLVVFRRLDEPRWVEREAATRMRSVKIIESEKNDIFKNLKKLLTGKGIKKRRQALVFGLKQTKEVLEDYPELCNAWITSGDKTPPPSDAPARLSWIQLAPKLFEDLDAPATGTPLLLIDLPEIETWNPEEATPNGCGLLVPFQDPENVGAVIRSAAAFGVDRAILLSESANPYHPKAMRASGGAVLRVRLLEGPSIQDLPESLRVVPLSAEGREEIGSFDFPAAFLLLPGLEGGGLPEKWRNGAVSVPIGGGVESLNAATATAIALYVWSQRRREKTESKGA